VEIENLKFDYKGLSADDAKEIKSEVNKLKSSIKHYKSDLKRPVFKFFSGENSHQIAKRLVKNYSDDLLKIAKSLGMSGLKMSPAGLLSDIGSKLATKSEAAKQLMEPKPLTYKRGGLVGINNLTRPLKN
jgi:ribosomal protein L10